MGIIATTTFSSEGELNEFISSVDYDRIKKKQAKVTPLIGLYKLGNLVAIISKSGINREKLTRLINRFYPSFEDIEEASFIYGEFYTLITK